MKKFEIVDPSGVAHFYYDAENEVHALELLCRDLNYTDKQIHREGEVLYVHSDVVETINYWSSRPAKTPLFNEEMAVS